MAKLAKIAPKTRIQGAPYLGFDLNQNVSRYQPTNQGKPNHHRSLNNLINMPPWPWQAFQNPKENFNQWDNVCLIEWRDFLFWSRNTRLIEIYSLFRLESWKKASRQNISAKLKHLNFNHLCLWINQKTNYLMITVADSHEQIMTMIIMLRRIKNATACLLYGDMIWYDMIWLWF